MEQSFNAGGRKTNLDASINIAETKASKYLNVNKY